MWSGASERGTSEQILDWGQLIDKWLQKKPRSLPGSSLLFFKGGYGETPSWHCLNRRLLGVQSLFPRGIPPFALRSQSGPPPLDPPRTSALTLGFLTFSL